MPGAADDLAEDAGEVAAARHQLRNFFAGAYAGEYQGLGGLAVLVPLLVGVGAIRVRHGRGDEIRDLRSARGGRRERQRSQQRRRQRWSIAIHGHLRWTGILDSTVVIVTF